MTVPGNEFHFEKLAPLTNYIQFAAMSVSIKLYKHVNSSPAFTCNTTMLVSMKTASCNVWLMRYAYIHEQV